MGIRNKQGMADPKAMNQLARHLGRHLAREALREAIAQDPQIADQDKALTDRINGYFGGNVSYGTQGYDVFDRDQSRTALKKSDRRLTDTINQTFGARLGYTHFARTQNAKEAGYAKAGDDLINNTINQLTGHPVVNGPGMPSTDPAQSQSLDGAISQLGGKPVPTDVKSQSDAMDGFIKNMFGSLPANAPVPATNSTPSKADSAAVDDLLKRLSS